LGKLHGANRLLIGNPKTENRNPKYDLFRRWNWGDFGFRPSFGIRYSGFGLHGVPTFLLPGVLFSCMVLTHKMKGQLYERTA
jgi:hypothetical protein